MRAPPTAKLDRLIGALSIGPGACAHVGKHEVRATVRVDHSLAGRAGLADVGLTRAWVRDALLVAVAASVAQRHRIVVELSADAVVGHAAIGF